MGSYQPISRVAIIGAGPVGLTFAKYLSAEKMFEQIDIFEQRDRVGGIWNLSSAERTKNIPIPQTNPRYGQLPDGDSRSAPQTSSLEFESPLYDYLETNIPKPLMAYSNKPFPSDAPLFPPHESVLKYLEDYAGDVKHLINFNHQVRDVSLNDSSSAERDTWRVEVRNLSTTNISISTYDAIVVSNGHYTTPSLPSISGMEDWNERYPGAIIHSKAYRRPEDFGDQKVLVIGNSASGLDIAFQVSQKCKQPVLLSSRSISAFGTLPKSSWREDVDEVVEFLSASDGDRALRFKNGRVEHGVDSVIFATGYFYAYPFLSSLNPPVVTDGLRTRNTYHHLLHIEHPTLVFPVINLKVIPFPLAENQAAVVARVWSGRLRLPSMEEMREWEKSTIAKNGDGKYFHLKRFPEDAAQINELYQWAESASKRPGLENEGRGRLGTAWNEKQVWMRGRFPAIKGAYMDKGEDRLKIRTIEELGFDFDRWREEAQPEDLEIFQAARC